MRIRTADLSDLKEIARVEAACFPAAEAATEEEFEKRLTFYKDHFWLMFEEEKLIAFVDGMVTNQEDLTDEMYEKAEMHDEKGDWHRQADHSRRPVTAFLRRCDQKHLNRTRQIISQFII